jgi:hypothetical protein
MKGQEYSTCIDEGWKELKSFLPDHWQEKSRETGAIQRELRKFPDVEAVLRTLMIHLLSGSSLRETKAIAKAGEIADVSDVAVLKRLKRSGEWMRWMTEQMIGEEHLPVPSLRELDMGIRIVDATHISEPASTGSNWLIHYSFDLVNMRCDQVKVTDYRTGETFRNFAIEPQTLYIGDRGLYHWQGIKHVCDSGGDVLVRMTASGPNLYHPDGKRFGLWTHLHLLGQAEVGDWPVMIKAGKTYIPGRLCAIRKSRAATRYARKKIRHEHRRKQKKASKAALEAAKYVFVFTTLSAQQLPAEQALELYRGRWQVELVFKRMKSLLGIGQLHDKDPQTVVAWLHGKLFCALLIEKLLEAAEFFFPQDYARFDQVA